MNKVFFHVDLDAFFASVEQLDHPEYRGKPVIVGGLVGDVRSVVSTASYEARKFGVHSAMPTSTAYKLCPNGIFLRGNMKRYHEKSEEVMTIFKNFSPDVYQMSIDEAFIDMTGTEKLFGNPIEAAKKLKQEIKEKTGLTVSIGIATNKYLAKIASGLKKPDGLFIIKNGDEENFMLNLPLEKVWGVGKKTLEKLKNFQIKTTKDIHQRSLSLLKNLFGNATGNFLYNAVRGKEAETFILPTKNHSISNETTYEVDLLYSEQFNNALMELCNYVYFRILKEKIRSKTVFLKIRYDDFTTVSIQETHSTYISSTDDFYQKIKSLFEKKYNGKNGVRLFGVGVQNVESEAEPFQAELFDFSEEKKSKVEKAILKATEKNPTVKITKASLLKKLTIFLCAITLFFSTKKSYAQTVNETTRNKDGASSVVFDSKKITPFINENAVSLFNYEIDDQKIEFLVSGWWKSSLSLAATMSTGFGTTRAFSTSPAIFSQDVDLSIWLFINKHWYFETAFANGFEKNTIAAGYIGDDFIKSTRIANRGIIFPSTYSIDDFARGLGGGDNDSPGFSLKASGKNYTWDTVLRYDMLKMHEKSWQGKNSISTDNISLTDWVTGNEYAFPDKTASLIKDVYVETYNGSISFNGRKFKKIDSNYFVISNNGSTLTISKDAKAFKKNNKLPAVIVTTYSKIDLGSYDDETTFLGQIQSAFGGKEKISLEQYSYDYHILNFESSSALLIQSEEGFSPFVYANKYDAGLTSSTDAQIASSTTEIANSKYSVYLEKQTLSFVEQDFSASKHTYATVYKDELNKSSNDAYARFPMAQENPGIYLGFNSIDDSVLRIRSFSPVSRLDIGSKAVAGTVKVYKNGLLDTNATYESQSGTINLSTTIHDSDRIYAQWYEDSEEANNGSIAFATGVAFDIAKNVTADVSLATRWCYTKDKNFAVQDDSSPGFSTLASKINWNDEKLTLSNALAISIENQNTTDTFRILSMDDEDETFYLSKNCAYNLPSNIIPTLTGTNIILTKTNDGSSTALKGIVDSTISGYILPIEWNFSFLQGNLISSTNPFWSSTTIALPANSSTLKNANSFSIALKNPNQSIKDKIKIYLQLGVEASDNIKWESSYLPTFLISDESENVFITQEKDDWQTITVSLTSSDKSRINSSTSARIIITSQEVTNGVIYIGPYKTEGSEFNIEQNAAFSIFTSQKTDSSLNDKKVKKLNDSTNYVQRFKWTKKSLISLTENETLHFYKYFEEIDLSQYKNLSLYIKPSTSINELKIDLDTTGENNTIQKAISLVIPKNIIETLQEETYYTLNVNLDKKTASINGKTIANAYINTKTIPSRLNIELKTKENGSLSIDELILTDAKSNILLQDKAYAKYKTSNAIFTNFSLSSTVETQYAKTIEQDSSSTLITSQSDLNFTIKKLHFLATVTSSSTGKLIPQASHTLETSSAIFNALNFTEGYSYDYDSSTLSKINNLQLDFSKIIIPLKLGANFTSTTDLWSKRQDGSFLINFDSTNFTSKSSLKLEQLSPITSTSIAIDKEETDDYFSSWNKIRKFQFSTGEESNSKRTLNFDQIFSFNIPFTKIKPTLNFNTTQTYKNTTNTQYEDALATSITLPFLLKKNNFIFKYQKLAGNEKLTTNKTNYADDFDNLLKTEQDNDWYFKTLPFADLFTNSLKDDISNNKKTFQSTFYTGLYTFSWKRNFSANKYDFFIPQTAGLNVSRDIKRMETLTDLYQFQLFTTYTAMNVFGKTGTLHLFNTFEQDEYITSFDATFKTPKANFSEGKINLSLYFMSNFYLTEISSIKNAFETTFQDKINWTIQDTFAYSRKVTTSPIASIITLFTESKTKDFTINRKDSINLNFTKQDEKNMQNISYLHNLDVQVNKYLTVNTDFSLSYDTTWNKIIYLNAEGTIGFTIKF